MRNNIFRADCERKLKGWQAAINTQIHENVMRRIAKLVCVENKGQGRFEL